MKLIELVNYFRVGNSYDSFCKKFSLDSESEVIEIFMKKPIAIENELFFFEDEKLDGKIEFISNGVHYCNLFDFFYFLDVIEELNLDKNKNLTDYEISKILYDYAINDA